MPKDTKPDEQKTERFNMFMSPSEMKAIDDWAWENKIRSKSEAVRRLLQIGIRMHSGYPGLSEHLKVAYETAQEVEEKYKYLFTDDELPRVSIEKARDLLIETFLNIMLIRSATADAVLSDLQLQREISMFSNDGEMDRLIAEAEAAKTEARDFWERSKIAEKQGDANIETEESE
jgi:hypothetical protein